MENEKKTISELVKEKITKENVKPIPKWQFVLKHGFLWLLLIILLIVAAISVGVAILEFVDVEWDLRPMLGIGIAPFIFQIFPYFWLILFGSMAVLAYFNFMSTPKGYKYPGYQIVLFGILLIILTGTGVHYLGMSKDIRDRVFKAPFIGGLMHNKEEMWNIPEKGLLAGEIVEYDQTSATLKSFDGQLWVVNIEGMNLPPNQKISEGQKVKIIGKKTGELEFKAQEARPWEKGDHLKMGEFKMKGNNDIAPPPPPQSSF